MEILFGLSINGYKLFAAFWNIFLALIPCWVVYSLTLSVKGHSWAKLKAGSKLAFVALFLFWFFFFPNTAYLFTMPRHLVNYCDDFDKYRVCVEQSWMVMIFFTYALIGVPTFYYALSRMTKVLTSVFGRGLELLFPILMIPLTTIGVMFGLFERFNSWDIVADPFSVLQTAMTYFTDSALFTNFLIFTSVFYLIYFGVEFALRKCEKM